VQPISGVNSVVKRWCQAFKWKIKQSFCIESNCWWKSRRQN